MENSPRYAVIRTRNGDDFKPVVEYETNDVNAAMIDVSENGGIILDWNTSQITDTDGVWHKPSDTAWDLKDILQSRQP